MKGRNIDAQEIQKRYGMVGDPVIIGVVLGLIFGLAAGEGFKGCATLMITVAAIMVLFPRMIRLIVEGLMPISDGARKFFQKHFKGREVFIGLDTAVTLGHPTTIAVGLLLIPIMLILASILPGNKVLPLADLPVAPFFYLHGHGYSSRRSDSYSAQRHHCHDYRSADRHPVRAVLYRYGAQRRL